MERLVNEIALLLNPEGKIDKRMYRGAIGFGISTFLFFVFAVGLLKIMEVAKDASPKGQEIVAISSITVFVIVLLIFCYYLIRYVSLLLITMVQYGFSRPLKNSEHSIESIMTSEVEDKRRFHRAIITYLKDFSAPKEFAALHIWLVEKKAIITSDKRFLDVLKTDFPDCTPSEKDTLSIHIPAQSSFSEQKVILEKNDRKEYMEGGYASIFQRRFSLFMKDYSVKE